MRLWRHYATPAQTYLPVSKPECKEKRSFRLRLAIGHLLLSRFFKCRYCGICCMRRRNQVAEWLHNSLQPGATGFYLPGFYLNAASGLGKYSSTERINLSNLPILHLPGEINEINEVAAYGTSTTSFTKVFAVEYRY